MVSFHISFAEKACPDPCRPCLRLCVIHNEVNARLHKPEFDCANLDATYDCGCGDDPVGASSPSTNANDPMDMERDPTKDDITGVGMIKGGRADVYL